MAQVTPSKQDVRNLKLIRANVDRLIRDAAELYDKPGMRVLDIAPQPGGGAKAVFKHAEVLTLDINPDNKPDIVGDICADDPDQTFDVVICTEVLEHVSNPFSAMDFLWYSLKRNGVLFISTPFNFRIHGPLPDNWRFTEHGLRQLLSTRGKRWSDVQIFPLEDPKRPLCPIHYTLIATA